LGALFSSSGTLTLSRKPPLHLFRCSLMLCFLRLELAPELLCFTLQCISPLVRLGDRSGALLGGISTL
jgi:hypothetical protein